jgi:excisionase family DNA binding protein
VYAENMDKLLTLKETAKILRVSERTIMRYLKSGKLKASKVGRWRIKESDLERFLRANENNKSDKRNKIWVSKS